MTEPAQDSPAAPPMLVVRDGRHPFEISFFVAAVLAGAGGLLYGRTSTALSRLLPPWEVTAWDTALLIAGLLGLVSLIAKFPFGLLVERVSLLLFGGLLMTQGIAISVAAVLAPTGLLMTGFAVACIVRVVQISRDLGTLQRFLDQR